MACGCGRSRGGGGKGGRGVIAFNVEAKKQQI